MRRESDKYQMAKDCVCWPENAFIRLSVDVIRVNDVFLQYTWLRDLLVDRLQWKKNYDSIESRYALKNLDMVFCYQNCSDLLWEKNVLVMEKKLLKFEAEGQEFAKFLRSLEQFIQTVKGQNNFW